MGYQFVAGDTGSKIRVTCIDDATKAVISLTGSTVKIRWRNKAGTATIEKTMAIVDATNGIAEYQFAAGELYDPGMVFRVMITDAAGKILNSLNVLREDVAPASP